ncbi:hypothetical protein EDM68_00245 [Candidatus Uhrbacteria bacterium]|nr:MAG: hypothetical protein EDM68_00245 [Candidatus Uhrbacteria bacterium]
MNQSQIASWVLRVAVAGEFIGHGVFALQGKVGWLKYFSAVGMDATTAATLLPWIGVMDIVLGLLVLVYPIRLALLWMAFWGFWTALVRPLAGDPIWDFIERWANWGAPLALLLLRGIPKKSGSWREWLK